MNIVINAVLSYEEPRGVGRYINNLLPAIADIDKDNQYYVYYGKWMKGYSFLKIKQDNFHFIELDIKNNQILRNLYLSINLPLQCKKYNPDVFFLIDSQAILIKPCKIVSTIHDLAEFVVPEKYSKVQAFIRRNIVRHQIKVSDTVMTVSEYSKEDICRRFGISSDRVHVTYNAVDLPEQVLKRSAENYFLFVGEVERAKNLGVLVEAFDKLDAKTKAEYKIKVVGRMGNDTERMTALVRKLKLDKNVEFLGYQKDEELNDLYSRAYAFVFPSIFEGFGLPVLEAMAKGTPVICSNSSSIPEVGGDAVLTFDPQNSDELKEQIEKLLASSELRGQMIEKGLERSKLFTKEAAAKQSLEILSKE